MQDKRNLEFNQSGVRGLKPIGISTVPSILYIRNNLSDCESVNMV